MKKKVGTFEIWLLAIAAVVAFSVLPKVSSLATEDQALVVKENKQEAADAAGDDNLVFLQTTPDTIQDGNCLSWSTIIVSPHHRFVIHITAYEVTQRTAEVFMTRIGEE